MVLTTNYGEDPLVLVRFATIYNSIIGRLFYKGEHLAFTLEDSLHNGGIIPGCFPFSITYSNRFKTDLPLIDVPGRSGIRIHAGNTNQDVTGCVLVGTSIWLQVDQARLMDSRKALAPLLEFLRKVKIRNFVCLHENVASLSV